MASIEEVLARLNPKTAQSFRIASEIKYEYLDTPSLGINMAIGGIGYGKFTTLWGNKGSGKSLFALGLVAQAQKQGKSCAWIDVEKNLTPEWAIKQGVDTDKMIVDNKTISLVGMANKGTELVTAGIDLLIIDSVSMLLPRSYFEDPKNGKEELAGLENSGQIGAFSKDLGTALNMINSVNDKTAIILISQVRQDVGKNGMFIMMGGNALEHANSTEIKLWRTPSDIIMDDVQISEGVILNRPVGYKATWTIVKNRGPGMKESNEYNVYTTGPVRGIGLTDEVITYGIEYGVIKKGGAWLTYEEQQWQGKPKMRTFLLDNPEIEEKIYKEIMIKASE